PAPIISGTIPASPSNNTSPTVFGMSVAGATVKIFKNGVCGSVAAATATADGSGNFSAPITVNPNTTTSITAKATDETGTGPCSAPIFYTNDTTAPAAPTITGTTPSSPSSSKTPIVKGNAEINSTVK